MNEIQKQKLKEAARLIQEVLGEPTTSHSIVAKSVKSPATSTKAESLPDRIIRLRDSGFFKEPRAVAEVHGKFLDASDKENYYYCEQDRVVTALKRLVPGKLRKGAKAVEGKKMLAYVW